MGLVKDKPKRARVEEGPEKPKTDRAADEKPKKQKRAPEDCGPATLVAGELTHGAARSAGYDLKNAGDDVEILPGACASIDTGVKLNLTKCAVIFGRSSLAARGVVPGGGLIDPGFKGVIKVVLFNHGHGKYVAKAGERVAQVVVMDHYPISGVVSSKRPRGAGGFGSTGK